MVNYEVFPPSVPTTEDTLIIKNKFSWEFPGRLGLCTPPAGGGTGSILVRVLRSKRNPIPYHLPFKTINKGSVTS